MADFLDSEAEESDQSDDEDLEPQDRKKLKKLKAVSDSEDEDEEDDEEKIREELKDLIDDRPIEDDDSGDESDGSDGSKKRKKSDDDDELDDRLEDEDYDLIEENLGVKVERRKRFKRLRRIQDEESDNEEREDEGLNREVIADQLFVHSDDDDERRSERSHRAEPTLDNFDEGEEEEESDADDFIVDDDGRPIAEKRKKRRVMFTDASLQEGQDIFGVDFDYDEFDNMNEYYESESEGEDEYEADAEAPEGEREKKTKAPKKKTMKKSIFEIYEPSELKRGHFTDLDNEIRKVDIPERMQLREVPITPVAENSNELEDEAEWIYKQAFTRATISNQDPYKDDGWGSPRGNKKPPSAIPKIKQAVDFIRNNHFEVPFIAFYRKEYVQPELNINDLWKVYRYDAKWCQLQSRKKSLLKLFEKMKEYQIDKIMADADAPIPEDMRVLKDDDLDRLRCVQSLEELKDVHSHFLLYYAHEIPAMQEAWRVKEKERAKQERRAIRRRQIEQMEENGESTEGMDIDDDIEEEELQEETLKHAYDSGPYAMCRKAQICSFAKKFGLTPEHFAENLRDNYQRHEVEQDEQEPYETAKLYITPKFQTAEEVLHAAKFVVARQISREPLLRKSVREILHERAKITVCPTKRGLKEIDENHSCFGMKYLKNKPVRDLVGDQFLKLLIAEQDDLLSVTINEKFEGNTTSSYLEEVKALYQRDEFAKNVREWNDIRAECVDLALTKMVLPDLRKELKVHLEIEAKEFVIKSCCKKICNWLKVAPYNPKFVDVDDEYTWNTKNGVRVMGLAYVPDFTQAAFCAMTAGDGDVTDYLRVPHILKRKNSGRLDEKKLKETDLESLKDFIRDKKPHVIVIGGESREAVMIQQDLREIIKELVDDEGFPKIAVEIIDNELAKIYSNSKKGASDFREYPTLLKQAVSLTRKMQDPLVEYSQLCTADEEILCLRYHTLQDYVPKEELLDNIYTEFINRTNEVGVDINLAVQNNLTVNLVQFISGLGPRKGQALIKILKQTNQRLENRTQLVTSCHMGPKVFINCSGFVKIDTNSLGDSTEAYVEVLDGSRVHPETYEWARKMAVDALEYDDEDANPAGALEEILDAPERLKDLDLDAFAVELERQGFGNKSITLYDIRAELNSRYSDLRTPFASATAEEMFDILTKEAPETFYVGKMVLATVGGYSHKKPQGDQLDQANPVRDNETGLWQCPFCLKNDFPELSEVWNHFDAKACPGQATGIKLRLDNGLSGFIHIKNLSDKHVKNPEERVQFGQTIHCRIIKIDCERFSVDCSSKSSDLLDRNHEWRPQRDDYYDQEKEEMDLRKEEDSKKQKQRQQYIKRVIVHPAFHNKSYMEVIKLMAAMDQGEVIVRPSSKGIDNLTVTWKVTDDIYQHIDVREEGKENSFSLGQSLLIGNEEFEDLDEIIARHVNPMASFARDLLNYKYYRDTGGLKDKAEELLKEEKRKNPNKIHYFISASKGYPGKFMLSYLPRVRCKHEYVTVTPDGFRFRQQVFDSLPSLLKWFKEHFKDPLPGNTPISTPRGGSSSLSTRTPYGITPGHASVNSGMSSEAIQRVAQNIPSHMLHSLSQAASQTPHYPHTPGYGGQSTYINTPYTPSGQTPFMTPYHTPHASATPRYGSQATPSQSSSNGQFVHPSNAVGSSSRGGAYHSTSSNSNQSPHGYSGRHHSLSPHLSASPHGGRNNYVSQENLDWHKAAESWATRGSSKSRDGSVTPRDNRGIPRIPTQRTPRYDEHGISRKTPQYDDGRPSSRSSRGSDYRDSGKSPRSARSTPRTNTSPHSMMLGDSTPLYDEN